MSTQALVTSGRSLSVNEKRRRVVMDADALINRQCANSLEDGLAPHIDACIMYVMPFVVHRVTWDAWPDRQGRSDIVGSLQEGMQSHWWRQENMLASRCAGEGVPIHVCSSENLRRATDETL